MRLPNAAMAALAGLAVAAVGLAAPAHGSTGSAAGCGGSGLGAPAAGCDGSQQPSPVESSERLVSQPFRIPAPSLANNLLGDRAELKVAVWLPTDYATSGKRYRTVYYLAGYGDGVETIVDPLGDTTRHPGAPFIIVAVEGLNALGGSFYYNSPVTGNWEDAITRDLVSYVDTTYRTVRKAAARGIVGHSMGGYGALQIAIDHPEIFSAVDALSPGVLPEQGMKATQVFGNDTTIRAILAALGRIESGTGPSVRDNFLAGFDAVKYDDAGFGISYGVAAAPDPSSRTWLRFPYREVNGALVEDPAVMAAWNSVYGDWPAKIRRHRADLNRMRGLQVEFGTNDEYQWIPQGCRYLDRLLVDAGVKHQSIEFAAQHDTRFRFAGSALPYLSKVLATR